MNGSCQGSHILSGTCKKESLVTCVSWVCRLRSLGLAAQALALPPSRRTLLNGEMEKGNWKWLRKTLEKTFHWISNESRVAVYPGSDDWHPRKRKWSKKSYFATFLETFLALTTRSMAWRRKECAPVLKVRHRLTGEMWGAGWRRGSLSSSWVKSQSQHFNKQELGLTGSQLPTTHNSPLTLLFKQIHLNIYDNLTTHA